LARYLYAATPADYVVSATTGLPVPSAVVTVWTARTGGSQVTDLQNLSLVGITQVTADSQGYLAFYGPDNMTANLWIYAGSGPRLLVRPVNDLTLAGTALPLSGGTMTGNLTLAGAPSANLHAATKQYVDNAITGFVVKTGDVLSGNLRTHQASMKVSGDATSYVFERRQGDSSGYGFRLGASATNPFIATLYDSGGNTISPALNYSTSSSRWNITGDTYLTGALTTTGNASVGGALSVSKVTGLAAASANGEAVRYEQLVLKLDASRVIGGKVDATTDANGLITFAIPTSPTGAWTITCTNANTDIALTNGLPHISVTTQTATTATVRVANSSDPAKAAQANKAIKFYYMAVAY